LKIQKVCIICWKPQNIVCNSLAYPGIPDRDTPFYNSGYKYKFSSSVLVEDVSFLLHAVSSSKARSSNIAANSEKSFSARSLWLARAKYWAFSKLTNRQSTRVVNNRRASLSHSLPELYVGLIIVKYVQTYQKMMQNLYFL